MSAQADSFYTQTIATTINLNLTIKIQLSDISFYEIWHG